MEKQEKDNILSAEKIMEGIEKELEKLKDHSEKMKDDSPKKQKLIDFIVFIKEQSDSALKRYRRDKNSCGGVSLSELSDIIEFYKESVERKKRMHGLSDF